MDVFLSVNYFEAENEIIQTHENGLCEAGNERAKLKKTQKMESSIRILKYV